MMNDQAAGRTLELDDLFQRARDGDEQAWQELVDQCYSKVLRVVRRRLDRPMRSLFDSTDFANDVFKSLFAKSHKFDFPNVEAVGKYLEKTAHDKVVDEWRKQHRIKRDRNRSVSFNDLAAGEMQFEPMADDPTPSQYAQASETRELLADSISDEDRAVLDLKAQDYSNEEVASRTGFHVRKVQRVLKKISDSWRFRQ